MYSKLTCILLINDRLTNFANKNIIDTAHIAEIVIRTYSADEALNYLANAAETIRTMPVPNLIIMDKEMPGFDAGRFLNDYRTLKSNFIVKPVVILLTSLSDLKNALKYFNSSELSGIYQKPLSVDILKTMLADYF